MIGNVKETNVKKRRKGKKRMKNTKDFFFLYKDMRLL